MYECLGCRLQSDSGHRRLFITDVQRKYFLLEYLGSRKQGPLLLHLAGKKTLSVE